VGIIQKREWDAMKRKDYITETKSIEHMNDLMGAILKNDISSNALAKYLKLIPVHLWDKIEVLDTKLKTHGGYYLGNLAYVLIKTEIHLPIAKSIVKKLDEYVCHNFDHVWSDEIVKKTSTSSTVSGLTTQRWEHMRNYVNSFVFLNVTLGQNVKSRYDKEDDRVYQAEIQNNTR
jgi:hypothetical protein